jgi:signal transduction histidine kinase/ActR/RegA family two-component response regulator
MGYPAISLPMSLEKRIFRTLTAFVLFLLTILAFAYHRASEINANAKQSRDEITQTKLLILSSQINFKKQVQEWKNILLRGHNNSELNKYINEFQAYEQATRTSIDELRLALPSESHSIELLNHFEDSHNVLATRYRRALRQFVAADRKNAFEIDASVLGIDRRPNNKLDELIVAFDSESSIQLNNIERDLHRLELYVIVLVIASCLLSSTVLLLLLNRWISRPVRSLVDFSQQISEGNLDKQIELKATDDIQQLADSLDGMRVNLRKQYNELASANRSLKQARDNALQATKIKSEFLANMSHEIRTPINGVVGMIGLLQQTALTGEQKGFVDVIQESSDSLLLLINDILDISVIESGKIRLKPTQFSITNLLEEVIRESSYKAEEKHLDLALLEESELPGSVTGDPLRLKQVLLNLITNAIKFTEEGGVLISCNSQFLDEKQVQLSIAVHDTGQGISEKHISTIFNTFSQADGSNKREFGGVGLGLSISQKLINIMGGTLEVESTLGEGSCFRLNINYKVGQLSRPDTIKPILEKPALIVSEKDYFSSSSASLLEQLNIRAERAPKDLINQDDPPNFSEYSLVILDNRHTQITNPRLISSLQRAVDANDLDILYASHALTDSIYPEIQTLPAQTKVLRRPFTLKDLSEAIQGLNDRHGISNTPKSKAGKVNKDILVGKKVLIVEDNSVNTLIIETILENSKCDIKSVTNGALAVETVKKEHWDLVLMDCQMPVLDGYSATQQIRALPRPHSQVLIVALTAHAMAGDKEKCLTAGMNDYLTKPIQPANFIGLVSKILDKHSGGNLSNGGGAKLESA